MKNHITHIQDSKSRLEAGNQCVYIYTEFALVDFIGKSKETSLVAFSLYDIETTEITKTQKGGFWDTLYQWILVKYSLGLPISILSGHIRVTAPLPPPVIYCSPKIFGQGG